MILHNWVRRRVSHLELFKNSQEYHLNQISSHCLIFFEANAFSLPFVLHLQLLSFFFFNFFLCFIFFLEKVCIFVLISWSSISGLQPMCHTYLTLFDIKLSPIILSPCRKQKEKCRFQFINIIGWENNSKFLSGQG